MQGINSEIIAGLAVFLLGLLFFIAGLFNSVWATIFIVDYLIMAIGLATIGVGVWTATYDRKHRLHQSEHHH
jgi:hypothetical protein